MSGLMKYRTPAAVVLLLAFSGILGYVAGKNPDWTFSRILTDVGLFLFVAWLVIFVGGFFAYATWCGYRLIKMDIEEARK